MIESPSGGSIATSQITGKLEFKGIIKTHTVSGANNKKSHISRYQPVTVLCHLQYQQ